MKSRKRGLLVSGAARTGRIESRSETMQVEKKRIFFMRLSFKQNVFQEENACYEEDNCFSILFRDFLDVRLGPLV